MAEVKKYTSFFRPLLLSVFLLCAILRCGIELTAWSGAPVGGRAAAESGAVLLAEAEQHFSQEATRASGTIKLKHGRGGFVLHAPAFAVAATVPLSVAGAPGISFYSLISTTSIQPQAP